MSGPSYLDTFLADHRIVFEQERVAGDFARDIQWEIERQGLSRAEVARRLNVSRSRVTQALASDSNHTIRSLVEIAAALGCEVSISIKGRKP